MDAGEVDAAGWATAGLAAVGLGAAAGALRADATAISARMLCIMCS
jgi:hypothetical protein